MEIELLSFGKIAEFITIKKLSIDGISDTDGLKKYLEDKFPQLSEIKYKLAVDKQIIQKNRIITDQATVAIMPPFSGG
ncbi:MoaD/ThiS family protein [Pedobacter paludis]|uniref:Molybdopterin synthase sulfur carrier subunit n=1 Tax=Pedobacter paludis TaxID=2203212 RepID=A0A317EW48_9SPHI|nr:MoaD/ThiS family protein [Pedobacter paludis]PWS29969.1 molybdopterin synthase sulfur carrier subunit [Pedobacter paludis]